MRGRIAAKSLSNASATTERYLTGAEFDIESIQLIGENFWFGDESGPYLIRADCSGRVTGVFETRVVGQLLRSPDHYTVNAPALPGAFETPVRRSRGFEGMAASPDGRFLYPMLEGPVWDALAKAWESRDGKQTLRILEFERAARRLQRPHAALRARGGRQQHRRLQHDRHGHGAGDRARQRRGRPGAGLRRRTPGSFRWRRTEPLPAAWSSLWPVCTTPKTARSESNGACMSPTLRGQQPTLVAGGYLAVDLHEDPFRLLHPDKCPTR